MAASDASKGNAGKKSEQAAASVDKLADNVTVDQTKIFQTPAGLLNSLEPPIAIVDRVGLGGMGALKSAVRKINAVDTITGLNNPKGIVLRIENPDADKSTSGILDTMLDAMGVTPEKPIRKAKVLIPGIHGRVLKRPDGPGDPTYPNAKNKNDKIIDLYPTFKCISNDPEFDQLQVGDIVTVDFPSKNNFSTSGVPLIISVMNKSMPPAAQPTPCNDSNTYQANPPKGDALPAGQRATGHTGKDGHALRARKKRSKAQYFAHKESGDHLLDNIATMMSSKGYTLATEASPGNKISKKEINKDLAVYQHTATMAELIASDTAFSKNSEMIIIVFRSMHGEGMSSPQEEKYKIRSIVTSLVQTIDAKVGGQPMLTLIADYPQSKINTPEYQIVLDAFGQFLPNDPDFTSMVNINRINFQVTAPSYEKQSDTKLTPNGSALFVQKLMKSFSVPGSDPSPVENKKPGPVPIEAKKPAAPEGYMASQMLLDMLERASFPPEPGLAKQFLLEIAKRLNLEGIEGLKNLGEEFENLDMQGVTSILNLQETLSPEAFTQKKDQIAQKIKAARKRKEEDDKNAKAKPAGNAPGQGKPSSTPPASSTPTTTQPNSSCGTMSGGNATVGARSYPSVGNSFIEGSESGSDMMIPNISPQPVKDTKVAKKARTRAHNTVGKGVSLPAGLETGGKIPMKFTNVSDFAVYHGLGYTRGFAKQNKLMPPPRSDFSTKTVTYLRIGTGALDPKFFTKKKKSIKPTVKIVARALNAFNAAWEEIHKCPEGKNFMYGTQDANQSYQFIVKSPKGNVGKGKERLTKRFHGPKSATAAVNTLIQQGHDVLGPGKTRSRLGLSHVSGVGFDLRSERNNMTKKRLKPSKAPNMPSAHNPDPNWWKSQYNIDINAVVNQTPEGSNKTYELMPMDHPACITKILKKYGFRWGGDYGSHKSRALTDAMHYEFFGDPRILDKVKAKSYQAPPGSPKGGAKKAG